MERLQPHIRPRFGRNGLAATIAIVLTVLILILLVAAVRMPSSTRGAAASAALESSAAATELAPLVAPTSGAEGADPLAGVTVSNVGDVPTKSDPSAIADKAIHVLGIYASNPANVRPSVPVKLLSITAVMASNIRSVETRAGAPDPGSGDDAVVWVVRAQGPFIGLRVPPGRDPIVNDSGYLVIDDATQSVVSMGMP